MKKYKVCRKPDRGNKSTITCTNHFGLTRALVTFGEERHRWERDHGKTLRVFGLKSDLAELNPSQYVLACTDSDDPLGTAKVWVYRS